MNSLNNLRKNLVKLIPFILLIGCISPIDFRIENSGGDLVVSGQISTLNERTIIQIGRTANGRLPIPIGGASVILFDNNGNSFQFYEPSEGKYILPSFSAVPDQIYHVQIILPDGNIYESTPEKTPVSSSPVNVEFEFVNEVLTDADGANLKKDLIKIYASTEIPTEEPVAYLSWYTEEVFLLSPTDFPDPFGNIPPPCYVTQKADPNNIPLFDGSLSNSKKIDRQLIAKRLIDRTFLERHYFSTYQGYITKEAHEYWRKINILANSTGSIFDTPPAKINGNIKNINNPNERVWGYVQNTNETLNRFFLLPDNFPFRIFFPTEDCTFYPFKWIDEYPKYCLDCLSFRNSSMERPVWF